MLNMNKEFILNTSQLKRKKTEYYAIEHQTEYIPQIYTDKYVDYTPIEKKIH